MHFIQYLHSTDFLNIYIWNFKCVFVLSTVQVRVVKVESNKVKVVWF